MRILDYLKIASWMPVQEHIHNQAIPSRPDNLHDLPLPENGDLATVQRIRIHTERRKTRKSVFGVISVRIFLVLYLFFIEIIK